MCKEIQTTTIVGKDPRNLSKDDLMISSFELAFKGIPASYKNLKSIVDSYLNNADDPVKFAIKAEALISKTEEEMLTFFTSLKESVSIIKNSSSFIHTKEVEE